MSKFSSHSADSSSIGPSLSAVKITTTLGSCDCNQYSPSSSKPSMRPFVGAFPSCGPCILRARKASKVTELPSFSLNNATNNTELTRSFASAYGKAHCKGIEEPGLFGPRQGSPPTRLRPTPPWHSAMQTEVVSNFDGQISLIPCLPYGPAPGKD